MADDGSVGGVFPGKKLIDAVYQHHTAGGIVPELMEYRALSEFGWTQRDYDRADHARLHRVLMAHSINSVLEKSDAGAKLSDNESELLGRILDGRGSYVSGDVAGMAKVLRGDNG